MKVVEDFESRPHEAVSFVVKGERRRCRNGTSRSCRRCCLVYSGARLPGRNIKEKGREEGEVDKDGEERKIKKEIAQEVVEGIKEEARAQDEAEEAAQRSAGRSAMRSWDCSHKDDEEEISWREEDQMAAQWVQEQTLEDILERRRMEGCSWQLEIMQKAPEQ